ncbi:MAG: sulfotransferase family protein [Acidimicrobiia bacterium]
MSVSPQETKGKLRLVGAGLPRTGTHSLKLALEQLLGAPCYHMLEVIERPDHVLAWQRAVHGDLPDWDDLLAGYRSGVDWPVSAFWKELSDAAPDAVVLLSVRDSPASWWRSIDQTVLDGARREPPPERATFFAMLHGLLGRFCAGWSDADSAMAAYEHHNAEVRATVASNRLVEWRPGDGWEPICEALGVAVPDAPFPHSNTTSEFRARAGLDIPRP